MKKHFALITALLMIISLFACNAPVNSNTQSLVTSSQTSETSITDSTSSNTSEIESSQDISDISSEVPVEPAEDTVISFLACPDNIIHPTVYKDAIDRAAAANGVSPDYSDLHNAEYDFSPIYEYIAEDVKKADVSYLNQETLLGGTCKSIAGYPNFNTPTALIDTIVDLDFDVVNVAHNHMLDSGDTRYLENCNSLLESNNIEVIGYYPDKDSLNNIRIIEEQGIKLAFLAYTYGTNGHKLPSNSSFVIPFFSEELVTSQVTLAKTMADIVIVSCHWGYENTFSPNKMQKQYAKLMCDLEVDVVLGMHPHVIQPVEWMTSESGHKTLVIYSLGNLISSMSKGMNMLGGLFRMDIRKDAETGIVTIESPLFIPIVTHYNKSHRDYKVYYLSDYTAELALSHGVTRYDGSGGTLEGGKFTLDNLYKTVNKYISNEFLPEEYRLY